VRTLAEIVPLRTAACRDALDAVAMLAAGENGVEPRAAAHVESCLRCQAEVVAYRRVLATMRTMRHELVGLPSGAVDETVVSLHAETVDSASAWAVRAAYVGGITAAGAGVLVWLGRRRLGLANAS
jgi:hypothetical protein